MYADGAGLYLQVSEGATRVTKSWIYRFALRGRERQMGLGSLDTLSLADARVKAAECRRLRHKGIDPIETRKAQRAQAVHEAAAALTFGECADRYIAAHGPSWHNPKNAANGNRRSRLTPSR